MPIPTVTVGRLHFEDFDGTQFERLVFAYHARTERWRSLEWYGQSGKDKGRDIWGVRENDTPNGESVCILCANWEQLIAAKACSDMDKMVQAPTAKPDHVRVVSRSSITSGLRDAIKAHAKNLNIWIFDIWSGTEFEEFLRRDCETLLQRFVQGVLFPDSPHDLIEFAHGLKATDDREALALISRVFDRPAFTTPFYAESNLFAFKQAITDTIQAINTGVWQTRDGKELGRLPSKYDLQNPTHRDFLDGIVKKLTRLRSTFDSLLKQGRIRPCGCGNPECPTYFLDPNAALSLDRLRQEILGAFRQISPGFVVELDVTASEEDHD